MRISCDGKEGFSTHDKAFKIIKKLSRKKGNSYGKRTMTVYRCKYCNKYHIGGTDNAKGK